MWHSEEDHPPDILQDTRILYLLLIRPNQRLLGISIRL